MLQFNLPSFDSKEKDNLINFFDEDIKYFSSDIQLYNQNKLESVSKIVYPSLMPYKVNKTKEENIEINISDKIFKVIYPDKISLFTDADSDEKASENTKYNFAKRTKSKKKMKRYKCQDNMRKMIKRRFINTYLKKALNKKLVNAGFHIFFEYLPQSFVGKVIKSKEKELLDMTLFDIFGKKEYYSQHTKNNSANYYHNSKILEQIKIEAIPELNNILNKKYSEIFEEYVNSEEFNVREIERLKNSKNQKQKKDDYYIEKYKYLAMHYIEFCSK